MPWWSTTAATKAARRPASREPYASTSRTKQSSSCRETRGSTTSRGRWRSSFRRQRSGPFKRPDLPAFLACEYRDRIGDRGVDRKLEDRAEQRLRFSRLEPEGGTALAVVEVEKPREPAFGPQQPRYARRVAWPKRTRERAQERALVDEVERPAWIEPEEILPAHELRQRAENPLRPLHRSRREIDGEHVVPRLGEGAHLIARAAARNENALPARLGFQELMQRRRYTTRVPGREAFAEALFPEFGLRRVLARHRVNPSRRRFASACERPPPDRSGRPSPSRCPCKPPGSRRARPCPCGIRRPVSARRGQRARSGVSLRSCSFGDRRRERRSRTTPGCPCRARCRSARPCCPG